jgi:sugar lactone lactonase YvrE
MLCRTFERKTGSESTLAGDPRPVAKGISRFVAGCSAAAAAILVASGPAARAASNYVPPIVTTASTTLYSSATSIAPGRVAVDRAGNTFYMVNGGTTSTLMEIPAASPAVTNTTPLTLITGLGQYNANVAFVDVKGNLWVSVGNGTAAPAGGGTDYLSLVEIPAVGGIPNTAAIPSGGETLNVVDATHCASTTTTPCTWQNYKLNSPGSSPINGPQVADLFVDGSGNVYFVDVYDNTSTGKYNVLAEVNLLTGASNATVLATNLPATGHSQVAVDAAGNVFYWDATTGVVSQVSGGALTTVGNTATTVSAQIATATGISADFYGNLYIASGAQLSEVPFEGTALNFADEFGIVNGLSGTNTNSITYGGSVDANGNYYYAYNSSSATAIKQLQINGYNFGTVNIGALVTGPSLTLYFNAAESGVSSYFPTGSPVSNTNAAFLQSFPYSGTKSFAGGSSFTSGQTGTITMNFQPIHPGLLKGSFTPRSNGSNDAIVNLQGVGAGPQAMFLPGVASSLFNSANTSTTNTTQVLLNGPLGLAVDTYGDIFVADQGNGKVVADCLATTTASVSGTGSGGTTNSFCGNTGYLGAVVDLGTGFTKPAGIALDGANNLYVVDSSSNSVTEIQGVNLASTTLVSGTTNFGTLPLSGPKGIAVDGYTNVYIADTGNNRIVKAHQFGAAATDNIVYIPSTTTFGGTALSSPTGLEVDSTGDLFIADKGNNRIVEYTALGAASVVSTTGITLNAPTSVKVLPSGTLVVTDTANNVSLITNGTGAVLPIGALAPAAPQGVALDIAGNIYISDTTGNRVLELAVSAPAAVAFPTTPQGGTSASSTTTLNNSGSTTLSFSNAPTSSSVNFSTLGSQTCTASATVAPGASCTVLTDFTPQAAGALTGSVTLTDNQLGYTLNTTTSNETATFGTSGTQGIALSGTATATSTITATPTFSPAGGTYTSIQSVTISDTTSGAKIYYTTDGTTPSAGSNLYSAAISVSSTETIQAIAIATGFSNSAVASAAYTINLPPAKPGVVMSQVTLYGKLTSGGVLDGGNPAGNTMAVNSAGTVFVSTTYGGEIDQFTPSGSSALGSFSNPGPLAIDSANNLYIGGTYNSTITKIPYVGGSYVAISTPTSSTPTCTGTDTTECNLPSLSSAVSGLEAMYFDASGNLFFSSRAGSAPNAIFECNTTCLKSASPAATMLYQEPVSSTAQLYLGGLAADKYGNLFFTDSLTTTSNLTSTSSNLKELAAATGGTGFASTPAVLYTYTTASPGGYDNQLDAVAVDATGTVYFATENDGIFALLNNAGTVSTTSMYTVSTQGAKSLTTDGQGNFYAAGYNNTAGTDAVSRIAVGNLAAPTVAIGSTTTATNITTALNDAACSATPTVSYAATEGGSATTEFSAATSGSCASTLAGGSAFATTLTFKPTAVGNRTATLKATDSNGGTGTATAAGVGSALPNAATPIFSPAAGTYTSIQSVTVSDATTGAAIHYTTDGTTPTTSSATYSGPISVGVSETINAIAVATGYNTSATGSAAYVINLPNAPTPTFSPAPGTFTSVQSVAISDSVSGATIYYTTDGTTPTTSSNVYSAPISVGVTETINAIAVATGYNNSSAGTAAYTINLPAATPTFSPAAGTYITIQSITIADTTTGAKIYYTTDGSVPTTSSTLYSGAITASSSETINAIAVATGYSTSAVGSAAFVINLPAVATPVILPGSGTFTTLESVTITDSTLGSKIYYTTDGTTPTASSTLYAGAITVGASETLKAIAVATSYSNSAVASATYAINLPAPNFAMAVNPTSLSIANGSQSGASIVVTSIGSFSSAVTFACSGLPTGVTCAFNPATVTPTATGVATVLTISAPARTAMVRPDGGSSRRPLLASVTLAFALCFLGWRKRRRLSIALVLMIGALGLSLISGCGTPNDQPVTSIITITATSGSMQQTSTLSVTIQ